MSGNVIEVCGPQVGGGKEPGKCEKYSRLFQAFPGFSTFFQHGRPVFPGAVQIRSAECGVRSAEMRNRAGLYHFVPPGTGGTAWYRVEFFYANRKHRAPNIEHRMGVGREDVSAWKRPLWGTICPRRGLFPPRFGTMWPGMAACGRLCPLAIIFCEGERRVGGRLVSAGFAILRFISFGFHSPRKGRGFASFAFFRVGGNFLPQGTDFLTTDGRR